MFTVHNIIKLTKFKWFNHTYVYNVIKVMLVLNMLKCFTSNFWYLLENVCGVFVEVKFIPKVNPTLRQVGRFDPTIT